MSLTRQARRGVAISSTIAVTAGFAAVAMASASADEADEPLLRAAIPSVTVDDAVAGKQVRLTVNNESTVTAENVAFEFELDEPADLMRLDALDNAKSDCDVVEERKAVCPIGDLEGGEVFHLDALVLHVFDGALGTGGTVRVTSDTTFNEAEAHQDFWVVGQDRPSGADLATWSEDEVQVSPGETTTLDKNYLAFYNQGSEAAEGIALTFQIPFPVQVTPLEGCDAWANDDFGVTFVECEFPDWNIPAMTELSERQGHDFAELTIGDEVEGGYLGFIDGFASEVATMQPQAAGDTEQDFDLLPRGGMPAGLETTHDDTFILMALKAKAGDDEPTDSPTSDDPTSDDPSETSPGEEPSDSDDVAPRLPATGSSLTVVLTAAAAFLAAGIAIMFLTRGRKQEESAEESGT